METAKCSIGVPPAPPAPNSPFMEWISTDAHRVIDLTLLEQPVLRNSLGCAIVKPLMEETPTEGTCLSTIDLNERQHDLVGISIGARTDIGGLVDLRRIEAPIAVVIEANLDHDALIGRATAGDIARLIEGWSPRSRSIRADHPDHRFRSVRGCLGDLEARPRRRFHWFHAHLEDLGSHWRLQALGAPVLRPSRSFRSCPVPLAHHPCRSHPAHRCRCTSSDPLPRGRGSHCCCHPPDLNLNAAVGTGRIPTPDLGGHGHGCETVGAIRPIGSIRASESILTIRPVHPRHPLSTICAVRPLRCKCRRFVAPRRHRASHSGRDRDRLRPGSHHSRSRKWMHWMESESSKPAP